MATGLTTALSDAAQAELLDRAAERGYVLASELRDFDDPLVHADAGLDDFAAEANDLGLVVVDDVAEPERELLPVGLATDPVRQYLNEAAREPLLDAEDEADLAKRYRAGLAAADALDAGGADLDMETRERLGRLVADGEGARTRMIRANLRLVVPTAKKYAGSDLPMLEALQEGNLGLIRAVERFDHTKGYKFSTYAVWWIRKALQRGLARRGRTVRVPSSVWEDASTIRRTEQQLRTELGREPLEEEVAERAGITPERIDHVRRALRPATSLDRPLGEDGGISLGDLLPDLEVGDPSDPATFSDVRARLVETLQVLPERERVILELRYGLRDAEARTLKDVGEIVGLTRERVRQLEREALGKLRDPAIQQGLDDVFDALAA